MSTVTSIPTAVATPIHSKSSSTLKALATPVNTEETSFARVILNVGSAIAAASSGAFIGFKETCVSSLPTAGALGIAGTITGLAAPLLLQGVAAITKLPVALDYYPKELGWTGLAIGAACTMPAIVSSAHKLGVGVADTIEEFAGNVHFIDPNVVERVDVHQERRIEQEKRSFASYFNPFAQAPQQVVTENKMQVRKLVVQSPIRTPCGTIAGVSALFASTSLEALAAYTLYSIKS